ncbi:hypothetical protein CR513_02254, partial [Mucuna pruriens]
MQAQETKLSRQERDKAKVDVIQWIKVWKKSMMAGKSTQEQFGNLKQQLERATLESKKKYVEESENYIRRCRCSMELHTYCKVLRD